MAKRGAAVLEMPEPEYVSASRPPVRGSARTRRGSLEDFADEYEAGANFGSERRVVSRPAVKLKVGSRLPLPTTMVGLVATGLAMVVLLGSVFWLLAVTRLFLLNDARFRVAGPGSIEIVGNRHLRRGQLLGLFADDQERNIFGVSLEQRQAELEAMPWVERATVMRLLPGRLRVAVEERTPVAFVRQGGASSVGLVDKDGVLLDLPTGPGTERFQFPVVTGIAAADPASVRAARMHLFGRFTSELDAGGAKNTEGLSEVDLSNPEDVRALVEEKGATVLVHLGEENFRERFDRMKGLLPQWRAQYPNLASADMRYEHEIPLGMAKVGPVALPVKPVAMPVSVKAAVLKPAVHPVVIAKAKAAVAALVKLPPPAHVSEARRGAPAFVSIAPPVPLYAPVPAGGQPSVSAAARSIYSAKPFAAKPPVLAAPVPVVVKAPVKVPVKVAPQAVAMPAPKIAPAALKKPTNGKPAAGKPLLTNDIHPLPTGAQR